MGAGNSAAAADQRLCTFGMDNEIGKRDPRNSRHRQALSARVRIAKTWSRPRANIGHPHALMRKGSQSRHWPSTADVRWTNALLFWAVSGPGSNAAMTALTTGAVGAAAPIGKVF